MAKKAAVKKAVVRKGERRRLLDEGEFRRLVETGQAKEGDRRSWVERRKRKA